MTSLRKLAVSLTALGCAGLLGCSSGGETPAAPALPPASASASPSASGSVPPAPSSGTAATPAPVPAPNGSDGATAIPPAPAPTGAPANPTAVTQPPTVQPNPANPGAAPPAPLGDPAQAVAAAGPQAQPYLKALQDRGIISNQTLDGIYVLFGQAVCSAKAKGESRQSILNEFAQIGPMLVPGSALSPQQVSEVFVSSAEQILC